MSAKGEVESGGGFAPLTRAGIRINSRKNAIMASLSKDMKSVTNALIVCHRSFDAGKNKMSDVEQTMWLLVFRSAEVGVGAMFNQVKESAALHRDIGREIDENEVWRK
ncbi:hypothetical protein LCGC14_0342960 [marine sediment metagenome]|uniref:Uncharacterized protein n=1 Tax=marine sediment metagenome TaxID=412755 RepID=A0A0F9WKS8_9ZZZZ